MDRSAETPMITITRRPATAPRAEGAPGPGGGPRTRTRVTTGAGAVAELARRGWDELLAATPGADLLRLSGVLGLGAPAGVPDATPRAVTVERDGVLVAAAPLGVAQRRGLTTIGHLGHRSGWLAPEPCAVDAEARYALVEALCGQAGDLLVLDEIPAEGALVRAVLERHPHAEVRARHTTYVADVTRDTPGMARRRKEAARTIRRAAEAGDPLTVRVATDWWGDIEPMADALLAFQAECRAGREMDPLTATPEGRALARRMLGVVGDRGAVRVATVHGRRDLLAFHLAIVAGTHAVGFKTAARRDVDGLKGVGWCSMLALNDHLATEGVVTVDMGPGGDAYKSSIGQPRPLVTVRVGISPLGRAYLAAVRGVDAVRALRNGAASSAGAWAAALAPAVEIV